MKKRIISALLSATLLLTPCVFSVSAEETARPDSYLFGDANFDSYVTIYDVTRLQRYLAEYNIEEAPVYGGRYTKDGSFILHGVIKENFIFIKMLFKMVIIYWYLVSFNIAKLKIMGGNQGNEIAAAEMFQGCLCPYDSVGGICALENFIYYRQYGNILVSCFNHGLYAYEFRVEGGYATGKVVIYPN